MDIQSALSSGLQGFQRASNGITEAAVNISRETTNQQRLQTAREDVVVQAQPQPQKVPAGPSLTESLVQLNTEQLNAEANIRSIRTADQVLGSLIDVRV